MQNSVCLITSTVNWSKMREKNQNALFYSLSQIIKWPEAESLYSWCVCLPATLQVHALLVQPNQTAAIKRQGFHLNTYKFGNCLKWLNLQIKYCSKLKMYLWDLKTIWLCCCHLFVSTVMLLNKKDYFLCIAWSQLTKWAEESDLRFVFQSLFLCCVLRRQLSAGFLFFFCARIRAWGSEWVNEAASSSVKLTPGRRLGFLYSIFPSLGINRQLPILLFFFFFPMPWLSAELEHTVLECVPVGSALWRVD